MEKIRIICLVGATATGKTQIGVLLAKALNAEIISADSIQIYRSLDIGSAKPTKVEQCGIPHHLMDCIDIDANKFSVSEYKSLADVAIKDIVSRGKVPLVVGGTGLYINALTYPLNFAEIASDDRLRAQLLNEENNSPGILHRRLSEIDKLSAERLHPNDIKRLIRAIEVYMLSGKPLSEHGNDFANQAKNECEYSPLMFGLSVPREILYERINSRVDDMLTRGLLEETLSIIALGYDKSLSALQGLGYKQLISYMTSRGTLKLDETIETIKRETRRFAKRQITWFKRDTRIQWFDWSEYCSCEAITSAILRQIQNTEGRLI